MEITFGGKWKKITATRRNIPEGIIHGHRSENLKFYVALTGWPL
jgi:hypothetical protein